MIPSPLSPNHPIRLRNVRSRIEGADTCNCLPAHLVSNLEHRHGAVNHVCEVRSALKFAAYVDPNRPNPDLIAEDKRNAWQSWICSTGTSWSRCKCHDKRVPLQARGSKTQVGDSDAARTVVGAERHGVIDIV